MEGEEGEGMRLSKRFSDKGGEVDYKTTAGTAWSHSYLNQKPWHPLSYPNQRRKWIAEQTHAQRQRRAEDVAREYAQEQEFFRQTALISKKEKEKVELMQAVSFMYVRPPGYNAESAKAAEIADEKKKEEAVDRSSSAMALEPEPSKDEKKKPRPKDVFGRALPTEEEFEVLKNAPRLETGVPARVKPFGVEVRNVKCLRCGNYGHQSGDRECPLKDAIMPNEESRLKRDDPLNAILAHADPSETFKWELKQKPGISPPRGGFNPDDPNQQIVAEEIFDEYGGFLRGDIVPELLTNFSKKPGKKSSKKSKHRNKRLKNEDSMYSDDRASSDDGETRSKKKKKKIKAKKKKHNHSESSSPDASDFDKHTRNGRHYNSDSSEDSDHDGHCGSDKSRHKKSYSFEDSKFDKHKRNSKHRHSLSCKDSRLNEYIKKSRHRKDSDSERDGKTRNKRCKHSDYYGNVDPAKYHHSRGKHRRRDSHPLGDSNPDRDDGGGRSKCNLSDSSEDSGSDRRQRSKQSRQRPSHSSLKYDSAGHHRIDKSRHKQPCLPYSSEDTTIHDECYRRSEHRGKHHPHR